jgi:subtilisin family serine protease
VGYGPLSKKKARSAWDIERGLDRPVTVAVIDSGLDFMHPDFSLDNLWVNTNEIPANFIDDDRNGYVDDVVGWNFVDWNNAPFDDDGHGTVVAGIIAANTNNSKGISGINWGAKVMVLKVSDSEGRTTAFDTAKAIVYAVNNGAEVINLSLGGGKASLIEQMAVDYATMKGVVVVAAAGNEGIDISDYAPASLRGVITVGGTDTEDKPVERYNYGDNVFIAAPAKRIFSLRARNTSTLGRNMLNMHSFGPDRAYYIADGTSFAAPIVSGTISLMLARDPSLSNEQIAWALRSTARDVGKKGWGPYTGFGRLDAFEALKANAGEFVWAQLWEPEKVKDVLVIYGTGYAASFDSYRLELGKGKRPGKWRTLHESKKPLISGAAGVVKAEDLKKSSYWTLRLSITDKNGKTSQDTLTLMTKDYF